MKATQLAARSLRGIEADREAKAEAARGIRRARRVTPHEIDYLVLPEGLARDVTVSAAAKICFAALLQLGPDARPSELAVLVGCSPRLLGPLFGELRRSGWLAYLLIGE